MIWGIRLAFAVLVLLFVLATVTSCSRREEVRLLAPPAAEPVLIAPRVGVPVEVLAAETRRAQVIESIARLTWVLRHTPRLENRIVLEAALDERRAELARLNDIIAGR